MATYIFTFPVGDPLRCDSFMRVEAADETTARLTVIDRYGRKGWAGCYLSEIEAGVARHGLQEIEFGG